MDETTRNMLREVTSYTLNVFVELESDQPLTPAAQSDRRRDYLRTASIMQKLGERYGPDGYILEWSDAQGWHFMRFITGKGWRDAEP